MHSGSICWKKARQAIVCLSVVQCVRACVYVCTRAHTHTDLLDALLIFSASSAHERVSAHWGQPAPTPLTWPLTRPAGLTRARETRTRTPYIRTVYGARVFSLRGWNPITSSIHRLNVCAAAFPRRSTRSSGTRDRQASKHKQPTVGGQGIHAMLSIPPLGSHHTPYFIIDLDMRQQQRRRHSTHTQQHHHHTVIEADAPRDTYGVWVGVGMRRVDEVFARTKARHNVDSRQTAVPKKTLQSRPLVASRALTMPRSALAPNVAKTAHTSLVRAYIAHSHSLGRFARTHACMQCSHILVVVHGRTPPKRW